MDEEKPKAKRGGYRPGAGRKPKTGLKAILPEYLARKAKDLYRADDPSKPRRLTARDLEPLALRTLEELMESCPADATRAAAATAVLRYAERARAKDQSVGKKEKALFEASIAEAGTDWDHLLN